MAYYASKVIKVLKDEVGYLEKASNKNLDDKTANAGYNNYTKYARDLDALGYFYNGPKQGYAYCDVTIDWAFVQAYGVEAALKLLCQPKKSYGAGCYYSAQYYKQKGQWYKKDPKPGDQIFFRNYAHTGLVVAVDKTYVYTIEGNTSTKVGVVANGGGVWEKKYKLTDTVIDGYGRPNYDPEPSEETTEKVETTPDPVKITVKEWQTAAIADGFEFPKYGADGVWGAECVSVARKAVVKVRNTYKYKNLTRLVQRVVGVTVDGLCGKQTDAAIREYQRENGLTVDGEVGLNTWRKILGV